MNWSVETLNAVVDGEILALPKDIQAAFLRLSERIEAVGLDRIGAPHVKHLQGKLWEMRLSGRRWNRPRDLPHRNVAKSGRCPCIAKKTQKTPRAALELAERRAKEIPQ